MNYNIDNNTFQYTLPPSTRHNGFMKRSFTYSLGIHVFLLILIYASSLISTPMKPPEKVYTVKILAAASPVQEQPKTKIIDEKPKPKLKPKPKVKPKPIEKQKVKKPKPKRKPSKKTLSQGSATVRLDGENFTDDFYLNRIINKIANNWLNPIRSSRKLSTIIYFKILKDGIITDIKVEKSSKNSIFDQSAKRAVMASSPLPPLAGSYSGDYLGVHFEFEHTGGR